MGDEVQNCNFSSAMDEDDTITVATKVEESSLKDGCIPSDIFKKPACLIYTDDEGLLAINQNVLSHLSRIERKLNLVGICGLYRTGKSYLMNWLAGEKTGFPLGDTVESKTKGIWVWCIDHPKQKDQVLVLIDTEGLDDPEKGDPDHDNRLFCLTMLLSNVLIVNIHRAFDYSAFDKLSCITKLSDAIRIWSQNDDDETNASSIHIASPLLIMCIRDFHLKLEKNQKPITPDDYLEDSLHPSPKKGRNHEKLNTIKQSITKFFPKRKCFTLPQPANGEDLQNVETLEPQSLNKDFFTAVTELKQYVYAMEPKRIHNASKQAIDGADLASLITSYVEALRKNMPIECKSAYIKAAQEHNERALNKVMRAFREEMDKGKELTSKTKLKDLFILQIQRTLNNYRQNCYTYEQESTENRAMEEMNAYFDELNVYISRKCKDIGTKWLDEYYQKMVEKHRQNSSFEGCAHFEADMVTLEKMFKDHMKEFDLDDILECLSDFKERKSDHRMQMYRAATCKKLKENFIEAHEKKNKLIKEKLEEEKRNQWEKRNKYLEEELKRLQEYVPGKSEGKCIVL